jgi:hypothetical protein
MMMREVRKSVARWLSAWLIGAAWISGAFPNRAEAHFLWILLESDSKDQAAVVSKAHVFLSETPVPEGPELLKYVDGVSVATEHGVAVPLKSGEESREATWLGAPPEFLNAQRDMGIKSRDGKSFRLAYTARMQSRPVKSDEPEVLPGLRVRLVSTETAPAIQVNLDGKPVSGARMRLYAESGDPVETKTNEKGLVVLPNDSLRQSLRDGKLSMFANWADGTAGKAGEKAYDETRHYATWTFGGNAHEAGAAAVPSAVGTMPEPAVNSFGGAVLGDWLYVYSGHIGKTHKYDTGTTTKTFRRFDLKDRKTWEDLPIERDLQGVALVSDGKYLYRTGGMYASNPRGETAVLHSVTDCERFDPETRTWTKLPGMPEPRSTHDAYVIGRTLYVAGGWNLEGSTDESDFHTQLLSMNLDKPEEGWKAVDQPFERRALSVAEYRGKLFVLGGLTSDSGVSRVVDIYDPASGSWSKGPELPAGTKAEGFGTAAFTIGGRLYYNGVTGPIYRLSKDGSSWEAVGRWHVPRITHRILPGLAGDLIAVGGNVGREQTPVIESLPVHLLPE